MIPATTLLTSQALADKYPAHYADPYYEWRTHLFKWRSDPALLPVSCWTLIPSSGIRPSFAYSEYNVLRIIYLFHRDKPFCINIWSAHSPLIREVLTEYRALREAGQSSSDFL